MSNAYFYKGFVFERDVTSPLTRNGGKESQNVSSQRVNDRNLL